MSETRHKPLTPSWGCSACGDPWPCRERKIKFLEDYQGRRSQLRATLGTWLISATEDLSKIHTLETLHERFVSWAYREPAP